MTEHGKAEHLSGGDVVLLYGHNVGQGQGLPVGAHRALDIVRIVCVRYEGDVAGRPIRGRPLCPPAGDPGYSTAHGEEQARRVRLKPHGSDGLVHLVDIDRPPGVRPGRDQSGAGHVPDGQQVLNASGGQPLAIGAESQAPDRAPLGVQWGAHLPAGRSVPEVYQFVATD